MGCLRVGGRRLRRGKKTANNDSDEHDGDERQGRRQKMDSLQAPAPSPTPLMCQEQFKPTDLVTQGQVKQSLTRRDSTGDGEDFIQ